jgi:hypothetical protein
MKESKRFAGYALQLYENTLLEHGLLDNGTLNIEELRFFVQEYNNYLCNFSGELTDFLDKAFEKYKKYRRNCDRINSMFKDLYKISLS